MACESDFSTMERLLQERRLGDARQLIALWFGTVKSADLPERAERVLIGALRERVTVGHVLDALG